MAGPSPDTTGDSVTTETTETTQANSDVSAAAAPSTAEQGAVEKTPSLVDSVKEALSESAKEKSPGSAEDGSKATDSAARADGEKPEAEQELGELTDDELKRYAPKTQRRIQQLLTQRGELETRAKEYETDAQVSRTIHQFATENGLNGEDVEGLLEIGALVRNDPFKAVERLTPIYSELLKRTGHVLPPQLQERVQQGYLTEQDARELAQSQTRAALAEESRQRTTEQAAQERQRAQFKAHVDDVRSVGATWEAAKKASDPDWSMKQSRVGELVKLAVYEKGYPNSKADVSKMLDGIYKSVTDEFAKFSPKPREITPARGTASSPGATAAPKTLLEAAKRALSA